MHICIKSSSRESNSMERFHYPHVLSLPLTPHASFHTQTLIFIPPSALTSQPVCGWSDRVWTKENSLPPRPRERPSCAREVGQETWGQWTYNTRRHKQSGCAAVSYLQPSQHQQHTHPYSPCLLLYLHTGNGPYKVKAGFSLWAAWSVSHNCTQSSVNKKNDLKNPKHHFISKVRLNVWKIHKLQ